jgi:hypothetical protein
MAVVDSRFIGPYLTSKGWEGQLIAFLLTQLSADGQAVQSMKFNMRGKLTTQTVVVKAEKLWEGTEKDVNLLISMPDADKFSFVGGELSSDLLAQDNVKMSATKGDNIILPSDWEASKVGDLCFRLLAYPVMKSSNTKLFLCSHIKFTVLAFPMAANDMAELTDAKQSESWPGIKILEGKCEFFPRSQENTSVLGVAAVVYRQAGAQLHHNSESQRSPVRLGGVTEDSSASQHVRGTQHAQEG